MADGHWWAPGWLQADEDLVALHGRPRFQDLLAECGRRQAAAQAVAEPWLLTATPSHTPRPFATLVVLHGRGLNAEDTLDRWAAPVRSGWLVAAPQSSQPVGTEAFSWDDPSSPPARSSVTWRRCRPTTARTPAV